MITCSTIGVRLIEKFCTYDGAYDRTNASTEICKANCSMSPMVRKQAVEVKKAKQEYDSKKMKVKNAIYPEISKLSVHVQ